MRNRLSLVGLALVAGAVFIPPRARVVGALDGAALEGVSLEHGIGYLALAPFMGVMDYVTVLTVPQHVMVLLGVFVAFVAWRLLRRPAPRSWPGRLMVELAVLVGSVIGLTAFYAAGVLAPRPMAGLVVDDPDVVVVDFHSHTRASHDGRWDFSEERNRAWHRGAGIQVAFIADHDSVSAALRAMARNPDRAGDGTVILPARELVYAGQHVVALGLVDPREGAGEWRPDPGAPDAPHHPVADREASASGEDGTSEESDPRAVPLPSRWCAEWPVLIQTIPNDLGRVPVPACTPSGAGVDAIELLDGDPRGLIQSDEERERILAIADSLGLALVSASNLHGWGRAAASWNLMRIPGWRGMAPEEVGERITWMLRHEGRSAVEVVAYRRPTADGTGRLAAVTGPLSLVVHFIVQLSRAERLAWLAWLAIFLTGARLLERRRTQAGASG